MILDDKNEDRIFSTEVEERETRNESQLRPKNFLEYVGQKTVVKNVELMAQSSLKRNMAMDHILLAGPPGLGKTSLALILAQTLESQLHVISGPAIEKKGDLASILTNLRPRDILFIDEIHRIPIAIEEILYSAMEDFRLDIVIGQGPSARTMQINIEPFTLIGATTRSGMLSGPLRDRFVAHLHFDFYKVDELSSIIAMNAKKIAVNVEKEAVLKMATCSRGTPRIANRILRRVRDFVLVDDREQIAPNDVDEALKLMDVDQFGLDRMDRKILEVIDKYYGGGPVGIEALCATLSEDRGTIEDVHEPYLLKEGFILRTPRGRQNSEKAKEYLKKSYQTSEFEVSSK